MQASTHLREFSFISDSEVRARCKKALRNPSRASCYRVGSVVRALVMVLLTGTASSAGANQCKVDLVACQKLTGDPLSCRSRYLNCVEDASVQDAAKSTSPLEYFLVPGSESEALGYTQEKGWATARMMVRNNGSRTATLSMQTRSVVCNDGTSENLRFLGDGEIAPGATVTLGEQVACLAHGRISLTEFQGKTGHAKRVASRCVGLVSYRDEVLLSLLRDAWPQSDDSLGFSENSLKELELSRSAARQQLSDLNFWRVADKIASISAVVVERLKMVPGVGEVLTASDCATEFQSAEWLSRVPLSSCVAALALGRVRGPLKELLGVAQGTHSTIADLQSLKAHERRAREATDILAERIDKLTIAMKEMQEALRREEALRKINSIKLEVDRACG